MSKEEREFIQINTKEMNLLREALGIKLTKCHYCKEKIDFKKNKYGILNKPTRLVCNSPLCICEFLDEDESKKEQEV